VNVIGRLICAFSRSSFERYFLRISDLVNQENGNIICIMAISQILKVKGSNGSSSSSVIWELVHVKHQNIALLSCTIDCECERETVH